MAGPSTQQLRRYGKPLVFLAALLPALWLGTQWWLAFSGAGHGLGFNPNEFSNRFTGDWALRFLLLSLALTPLATVAGTPKPILFRRMLGLFAYFYVCLHLVSYLWLDLLFDWAQVWADILKRIYITVGMAAFLLLTPLAVTSTKGWVRRLGARRWQALHKAVYAIGVLAVLHFIMMRKGFQMEPLVYGLILALLLVLRLPVIKRRVRRRRAA
jgi:sulfoxide reductase heme-binding subunit YedZ